MMNANANAARSFYVLVDDKPAGPMTEDQLIARFQAGEVSSDTLVTEKGSSEWKRAADVLVSPAGLPSARPPGETVKAAPKYFFEDPVVYAVCLMMIGFAVLMGSWGESSIIGAIAGATFWIAGGLWRICVAILDRR